MTWYPGLKRHGTPSKSSISSFGTFAYIETESQKDFFSYLAMNPVAWDLMIILSTTCFARLIFNSFSMTRESMLSAQIDLESATG
jgi:hypothetical protein